MEEQRSSASTSVTPVFRAVTSEGDWRRFHHVARRHLLPNVPVARTVYIVFGVLFGASLGLLPLIGAVGIALVALVLIAFVVAVVFNARFSRALFGGLAGELTMAFDAAAATVTRAGVSTTFEWSAVTGWSEDRDRFFVSVAPLVGWPLPLSGFTSEASAAKFRERLEAVRDATR